MKRRPKNESSWSSSRSTVSSILGVCSVIVHLHLNRYPCCTYPAASKAAGDSEQSLNLCPERPQKRRKSQKSCRSHRKELHRLLQSSPCSDPAPQKCGLHAGFYRGGSRYTEPFAAALPDDSQAESGVFLSDRVSSGPSDF